jgi:hypothetical protein
MIFMGLGFAILQWCYMFCIWWLQRINQSISPKQKHSQYIWHQKCKRIRKFTEDLLYDWKWPAFYILFRSCLA